MRQNVICDVVVAAVGASEYQMAASVRSAAAVKRYDSLSSESHACHSRIYVVYTHHVEAEPNSRLLGFFVSCSSKVY